MTIAFGVQSCFIVAIGFDGGHRSRAFQMPDEFARMSAWFLIAIGAIVDGD